MIICLTTRVNYVNSDVDNCKVHLFLLLGFCSVFTDAYPMQRISHYGKTKNVVELNYNREIDHTN